MTPEGLTIDAEPRGLAAGYPAKQYSIHRARLHNVLLQRCKELLGAENLIVDRRLSGFEETGTGVKAVFTSRDGETHCYEGTALIGADGVKSTVRAQLYSSEAPTYTGWTIWRGLCELDEGWLDGRSMSLVGHGSAVWVHYPVSESARRNGRALCNWALNIKYPAPSHGESWSNVASKDDLLPIVRDWTIHFNGITPLQMIEQTEVITAWALFDRDPVPRWSFGRVTLLGDAAHPLLPFGSQGASQAVLDCQALSDIFSELLAKHKAKHKDGHSEGPLDIVGALKAYDGKRVGAASAVVRANRDMGPTRVLRVVAEGTEGMSLEAKQTWLTDKQPEILAITRNYHHMTLSTISSGAKPVRVASAQFFSGPDEAANASTCVRYMQLAREGGARLVVFPENSQRERDYFASGKPSRELCWERCWTVEASPFLATLAAEAKRLSLYVAVGVDVRGGVQPTVHIASVLLGPCGSVVGVHRKTVLWDYEYTLFEASSDPYRIFDTEIGRLGLLICADGILPETARCLALLGAQVLVNSLNSRGPDEKRMHIPARCLENGLWHISSNTVGNPNNVGLLWPWTGGSQIIAPDGTAIATASETDEEIIFGEIIPSQADAKNALLHVVPHLLQWRRPALYTELATPTTSSAASAIGMLGPFGLAATSKEATEELPVAIMAVSRHHTRACTEWQVARQVEYAAKRGAALGVLPELFCFSREEVDSTIAKDPAAAAAYSSVVLEQLIKLAQTHAIWLSFSLVEHSDGLFYHTAYLVDKSGSVHGTYRKAHPSRSELSWSTAGDVISPVWPTGALADGGIGRVSLMIGDEVWLPEVMRILTLRGAEVVLHPCDWGRSEDAAVAASERVSENKTHLVSVARLDNAGAVGSQVTFAGEYVGLEPIPLMRYAMAQWTRYGVEEQPIFRLKRREPYCKMMGEHLDVLGKRDPSLYASLVKA